MSKEVQFERSRSIIDRLQIPQQEIVTPLASLGLYAAPARDDGEADRQWQWTFAILEFGKIFVGLENSCLQTLLEY